MEAVIRFFALPLAHLSYLGEAEPPKSEESAESNNGWITIRLFSSGLQVFVIQEKESNFEGFLGNFVGDLIRSA